MLFKRNEVSVETKTKYIKQSQMTLKLVSDKINYEIGKTTVLVLFKDGHEMTTIVYGDVFQYIIHGNDMTSYCVMIESTVYSPVVTSSINRAKESLVDYCFPAGISSLLVDDKENPHQSYRGEILSKKIVKTEKYQKEFDIYRVVPK